MQKKTKKPQGRPSVDWEAVRVLAIELGAREAARRLGIKESTVLSRAKRDKWNLPKRRGGATLKSAAAITLQSKPGDVLIASHKELEGATKTGLMLTAAKAATKAAQNPPLVVSNTSQFRDLANSSSRIFGWNTKAGSQTQFNQVVISQEQLDQIRALRASMTEEQKEEIAKRQATPEGQAELARIGKELQDNAQNMEQPKFPAPSPSVTCEVKIRGDGRGVEITGGDEGAMDQ
jgi:hypothetical protein